MKIIVTAKEAESFAKQNIKRTTAKQIDMEEIGSIITREEYLLDAVNNFIRIAHCGAKPLDIDRDCLFDILHEFEVVLKDYGITTYHPKFFDIDGNVCLINTLADLDDLGIDY